MASKSSGRTSHPGITAVLVREIKRERVRVSTRHLRIFGVIENSRLIRSALMSHQFMLIQHPGFAATMCPSISAAAAGHCIDWKCLQDLSHV